MTVWPAQQPFPNASTLNSFDGRVVANSAIVPAGPGGAISVYASEDAEILVDVVGYFAPPSSTGLKFYAMTPCRAVDTRYKTGDFGPPYLGANATRSFPLPASACNIPATAQAYSLNVTTVPRTPNLWWLTAWGSGRPPKVSTLNAFDGRVTANAAIVPAGANGEISMNATNDTEVIVDINGYFAPAGSPGALSFYTVPPCRAADTRTEQGFSGPFGPPYLSGARDIPLADSRCNLPAADAYSLNVTALPYGRLDWFSVWPQGAPFGVSTLNAITGAVTANGAIVPGGGTRGSIRLLGSGASDVIIDVNGFFAQ